MVAHRSGLACIGTSCLTEDRQEMDGMSHTLRPTVRNHAALAILCCIAHSANSCNLAAELC